MKKLLLFVVTLSVLLLMSVTVSARDQHNRGHYNDKGRGQYQHYDNNSKWHRTYHNDYDADKKLPFKWHERYNSMRGRYQLERIQDREWNNRFPGYRAYKWHNNEGFWHHGHYVTDAVFFYDGDDQLISVGYMANGVFIHFRADHDAYENNDSFFLSWWQR
ncbi:MAG TPA: hypothetical protein PKA28_12660 [Methylomusa anaerophila]|uniref:MORN repeat variant n=1 Tax=Methylomusa anaerophila TaxID=1930071 RepID=A0A348AH22_9FIRM|nr:hypothetical protein [Methylomusa anaerophila]BBB90370.1 hypothetical protein MAMMFC1_01018 [Methylomusa anaerophila]HML89283.1 hypothetical protein [Methylomusa anaerophila]